MTEQEAREQAAAFASFTGQAIQAYHDWQSVDSFTRNSESVYLIGIEADELWFGVSWLGDDRTEYGTTRVPFWALWDAEKVEIHRREEQQRREEQRRQDEFERQRRADLEVQRERALYNALKSKFEPDNAEANHQD